MVNGEQWEEMKNFIGIIFLKVAGGWAMGKKKNNLNMSDFKRK